jgi:putative toxin-antitoxin system antitoxin component (TIGR02293 family)
MATAAIEPDLLQLATLNDGTQIRLAEEDLPIDSVTQLRSLGISFTEVAEIVIPPRTLKHRMARSQRLSTKESERLLRVVRILAFADRVFGDHEKALGWLRIPDPRLGDRTWPSRCFAPRRAASWSKVSCGRSTTGFIPE